MAQLNHWETLQRDIARVHNAQVKEFFKDVPELSANATEGAINSYLRNARNRLRYNCLISDDDSAIVVLNKQLFFWFTLQAKNSLLPAIYVQPTALWEEEVTFKPQVQLIFRQDEASVPDGEVRLESQISFRLMDETNLTMNETKATAIANRIATIFGANNGYTYSKGKNYAYYRDKENGYDLRILVLNESEARELINKVVDIRQHTFKEEFFSMSEPKRNNNATRTTRRVYNRQTKERRWRPNATLRFQQAFLHLHGYGRGITLIDKSGRYYDGLAW